ncbi:MAG: hypothetical protein JST46_15020 [Bacteroidetes bacterium]|nr:hypothetical protein [Bacteroidota bacterium]
MLRNKLAIFLLGLFPIAVTCCAQKEKVKIISLPIDNQNSTGIGFKRTEWDNKMVFYQGISSICVDNNFVYMTDEVHRNVKRIDLNTSEITTSNKLFSAARGRKLTDIGVFGESIVVATFSDSLLILNKDLSIDTVVLLNSYHCPTCIHQHNDSIISIYVNSKSIIYSIDNSLKLIDKQFTKRNEKLYCESRLDPQSGSFRGKEGSYRRMPSGDYVTIMGREIHLESPYTSYLDSYNVDFDDNHLVIFDIDEEKFVLYVYNIKSY